MSLSIRAAKALPAAIVREATASTHLSRMKLFRPVCAPVVL